jgi:hypothetical protein
MNSYAGSGLEAHEASLLAMSLSKEKKPAPKIRTISEAKRNV